MVLKMFSEKPGNNNLKGVKHILGVLSGKGGVGKSTVTVNLALALAKRGKKVGILDADIYGPSIRKMLGEETFPEEKEGKILPAKGLGLTFLSLAFFQEEGAAAIVRAPIANQMIQQFLDQVLWGDLDILLIDFPPGTGDIQITLMQQAPLTGTVVVTTPQEVALLDVRKAMQMNEKFEIPTLGVVENMSYFIEPKTKEKYILFGEGGGRQIAEEFQVPLIGKIPIDPLLSQSCDASNSLFETTAPSRFAFEEAASQLEWTLNHLEKSDQNALEDFKLMWVSDESAQK